jgi:XTP/dITP diphosphohydrolase
VLAISAGKPSDGEQQSGNVVIAGMPTTPLVEVVMASANPHKVAEIEALLRSSLPDLIVLPRPQNVGEVIEDADTLLGNARLKAHALAQATQKPAVADDTGLFVDALGGDPGVFTARYAGEQATYSENCQKLLTELTRAGALQPGERTASFVTVAIVAWPDGTEVWAEGRVHGIITNEVHGDGGFGYDPVFAPLESVLPGQSGDLAAPVLAWDLPTFAQLGDEVKNTISHRSRAFESLATLLRE